MKNLILLLMVISLGACSRNIIVEREPNVQGKYQPKDKSSKTPLYHKIGQLIVK